MCFNPPFLVENSYNTSEAIAMIIAIVSPPL